MKQENLGRIYFFDNCKFIFIIIIVIIHFVPAGSLSPQLSYNNHLLQTLENFLFAFIMQAFVFISGYFSKSFYTKEDYKKLLNQLMLPYVILCTIVYVTVPEFTTSFLLDPPPVIWYLPALFAWRMLLPVSLAFRTPILIAIIVALAVGLENKIGLFMTLSRIFTFYPFFLCGFFYGKDLLIIKEKLKYPIFWGSSILLIAFIVIYFLPIKPLWLLMADSYSVLGVSPLEGITIRFCQIITSFILIFAMFLLIPVREVFYSVMGTRSIYPFLLHPFVVLFLLKVGFFENVGSIKQYFLILIAFIVAFILSTEGIKKLFDPILYPKLISRILFH